MKRAQSTPSRRLRVWVVLAWAGVLTATVSRAESGWIEVNSPHFTVISPASAASASRVAQQFEQIREVIRRVLPGMKQDPGQPIVILAVKDQQALRRLIPEYWEEGGRARPAGIFLRGPERHFVALRMNVGGDRPFQTVYHEYLHLLVSLNFPQAPLWVNEGLAEFYANSAFGQDDVVLGLPSRAHVNYLRSHRLLPLPELLQVDEKSPYYNQAHKVSIFYSQAWALVHYLLTQDWEQQETPLDLYLKRLGEGAGPDQAAQVLGDLDELERRLKEYLRQDDFFVFRYPEPVAISVAGFGVRRLSGAETKAFQASFLVSNQRRHEAESLIREAIATDPTLPLAFESLGYLRYTEGDRQAAKTAFARAVKLGSKSYLSHYFLGYLSLESATTPEQLQTAEGHLRRAISLRPSFPFSYTTLATLLLQRGEEHRSEALELAQKACRLEPHNGQLLQTLAYALGSSGRLEEAQRVLGEIYVWADSEQELKLAAQVEESLDSFRAYWEQKREYDRQMAELAHEKEATGQARSSWRTREVQGTVRSVSCSAPALMEIVLDTGGRSLLLISRNFSAVEFVFTGAKPDANFHPCNGLTGMQILASFQPDQEAAFNRLVSVKLK